MQTLYLIKTQTPTCRNSIRNPCTLDNSNQYTKEKASSGGPKLVFFRASPPFYRPDHHPFGARRFWRHQWPYMGRNLPSRRSSVVIWMRVQDASFRGAEYNQMFNKKLIFSGGLKGVLEGPSFLAI